MSKILESIALPVSEVMDNTSHIGSFYLIAKTS